jgi:hypothetical protein
VTRYGERDYVRTQEIGAAFAFLGVDALIAPSARWSYENSIIYSDNHAMNERLVVKHAEEVDSYWLVGKPSPLDRLQGARSRHRRAMSSPFIQ